MQTPRRHGGSRHGHEIDRGPTDSVGVAHRRSVDAGKREVKVDEGSNPINDGKQLNKKSTDELRWVRDWSGI